MQIHQSAEDYLETILMLNQRMGRVRSIDVVNELGFTKASVSIAMKKLRENGYIAVDGEGNLTLLAPGREIAERIYSRHRLLTHFFMQLGVDEKIASFVLPLGMTINMNGTTVMHMFAVTFIATASGIDITPANLITVAFLSICAAMGCPAIPIAGTTLIVTILSGMGWTSDLCMIAYALVVAINRPVEMALLPLNVIGDATVNVIVNKKENELDETKYNA